MPTEIGRHGYGYVARMDPTIGDTCSVGAWVVHTDGTGTPGPAATAISWSVPFGRATRA